MLPKCIQFVSVPIRGLFNLTLNVAVRISVLQRFLLFRPHQGII